MPQYTGVCPRCDKPKEGSRFRWCSTCREKSTHTCRRYYYRKKAEGSLCVLCRKPRTLPDQIVCDPCLEKRKTYMRQWKRLNADYRKRVRSATVNLEHANVGHDSAVLVLHPAGPVSGDRDVAGISHPAVLGPDNQGLEELPQRAVKGPGPVQEDV
jgi:hypothetical protein